VSSPRQILRHDEALRLVQRAYPSLHILSRYILAPFMIEYCGLFTEISRLHERGAQQDPPPLSAQVNPVVVASSVERPHPKVVKLAHL